MWCGTKQHKSHFILCLWHMLSHQCAGAERLGCKARPDSALKPGEAVAVTEDPIRQHSSTVAPDSRAQWQKGTRKSEVGLVLM